jgi:hypothetical protein
MRFAAQTLIPLRLADLSSLCAVATADIDRLAEICDQLNDDSVVWWARAGKEWLDVGQVAFGRACLERAIKLIQRDTKTDLCTVHLAAELANAVASREWLSHAGTSASVSASRALIFRRKRLESDRRPDNKTRTLRAADLAFRNSTLEGSSVFDLAGMLLNDGAELAASELLFAQVSGQHLSRMDEAASFLGLGTVLQRLGDSSSANACFRLCSRLSGFPATLDEDTTEEQNESWLYHALRDALRNAACGGELPSRVDDALTISRTVSAMGTWCWRNRATATFCHLLSSMPAFRELFPQASLRRQIRWMSRSAGWIPELVFQSVGVSPISRESVGLVGRKPFPLQVSRHHGTTSKRLHRGATICMPSPGKKSMPHPLNQQIRLDLGIFPDAPRDSVAFGPGNPLLAIAPTHHQLLALSAVRTLVQQGFPVLWLRSGSDRSLNLSPSFVPGRFHLSASDEYPTKVAGRWLGALLALPQLRKGLVDYLSSLVPSSVRSKVHSAIPEALNVLTRRFLDDQWLRPPADLAAEVRSLFYSKSSAPSRCVADLRLICLSLEATLSMLSDVRASLSVEVVSRPLATSPLVVLDLPDTANRSGILTVIALGGLLSAVEPDNAFTLNARLRGENLPARLAPAPARCSSPLDWWTDGPTIGTERTTCVILSGTLGSELSTLIRWFKPLGVGERLAVAVFAPSLPSNTCRRDTLGSFGTLVMSTPKGDEIQGFSAATGFDPSPYTVTDELYEWTIQDGNVLIRSFVPCPQ